MVSRSFKHIDGQMCCEQMPLSQLLAQCEDRHRGPQTPLFVYSKKQLHENVAAYMDALRVCGCPYQLNFAIKANQNLSLLKEFQSLGLSATLVSGNELRLALEAGFEPSSLMFNGGGKCYWETRLAIEKGVLINVDSEWDLRQTIEICQNEFSALKQAKVMLRLNLNIDPNVHKFINTGLSDCKFGLSEGGVEKCLQLLEEPGCPVELVGLHSHLGSTIYKTDVFRLSVERLLAIRENLIQQGFANVHILNVGGGLGIDYLEKEMETRPWRSDTDNNQNDLLVLRQFLLTEAERLPIGAEMKDLPPPDPSDFLLYPTVDAPTVQKALKQMAASITLYKDETISFSDLKDEFSALLLSYPSLKPHLDRMCPGVTKIRGSHASPGELISSVSSLLKDKGVTLMLEPGRSLVANTGVLLTRTLGVKQTLNKRFAVVDASMAEVLRPSLYGSYHHISAVSTMAASKLDVCPKKLYDIVGPVCECTDFLAKDRLLPDTPDGLLAIHDVGAYCHSMSSNYNVRMKAAEILVDGNTWQLIRRQDSYDDFMAPYRNLE